MVYLFVLLLLVCPGKVTVVAEADRRSWLFRPLWLVLLQEAAEWFLARQTRRVELPPAVASRLNGDAATEK